MTAGKRGRSHLSISYLSVLHSRLCVTVFKAAICKVSSRKYYNFRTYISLGENVCHGCIVINT